MKRQGVTIANGKVRRRTALGGSGILLTQPSRGVTAREREVLELIWEGYKNREVAHHLGITVKTVEVHRANLMQKLRVTNTAQLLRAGIEGGFLRLR